MPVSKTPEMIRRVAQAIERELNAMIEPGVTTTLWTLADKAARAAIAEMREPTEKMVEAARPPLLEAMDHVNGGWSERIWMNMIDAALK